MTPRGWYEPPEPRPCCSLAEDDDDHDSEACLADGAEAAAEAAWERMRDARFDADEW